MNSDNEKPFGNIVMCENSVPWRTKVFIAVYGWVVPETANE